MCGIAAIIAEETAADHRRHVAAMLDAISHRGPDGRDIWQGDGITLGHCRLAILDTSARAAQPLATTDATGILAYNGEIYNAGPLRELLKAEGCVFESSGDTEVVLQALHHWGPEKAVPLFNGMFALAYWDRRHASLWLARDRLGIKPLAIARHDGVLLIASEIKALNAHPTFSGLVRTGMIARWLGEPRVQAHLLIAEGIEELPPGALWRCAAGQTSKSLYFAIPAAVDPDRIVAPGRAPMASLVSAFETLIRESTLAHMSSDAPLASMCSGGVDSSLITALARRAMPDLVAYVADVGGTGEAAAALKVGQHLRTEIRQVPLDRDAFLRLWPEAVYHADGPLFHASDMALMAVAKAASRDGFKVLLTGEGSDELFGGYHWHMATQRRWRRIEGLRGLFLTPRRRERVRRQLERLPFASPWPDGTPHARVLVAYGGQAAPRQRVLMRHLSAVRPASERALAAACLHDLDAHLRWLLHRHDRMGMSASIEMRVPYLENRLIDFALHLPPGARIRHGREKWLVKSVAAKYLPDSVVHARKIGFPVPATYWKGCEGMLANGHLETILGWTRQERNALAEDIAQDRFLAFHLVGLELWLGQRLGAETPDAQAQRLLSMPSIVALQ
ncbi:asparagine synthase (glutamine-hydrolyzing) [Phreatobacter sp.]|uniref:asparagine synthase (glutamine-hydrolyzing) n=1 Tax=Phreatobacter sp. TaxID=1966341 RepID=UPI003F715FB6